MWSRWFRTRLDQYAPPLPSVWSVPKWPFRKLVNSVQNLLTSPLRKFLHYPFLSSEAHARSLSKPASSISLSRNFSISDILWAQTANHCQLYLTTLKSFKKYSIFRSLRSKSLAPVILSSVSVFHTPIFSQPARSSTVSSPYLSCAPFAPLASRASSI